MIALVIPWRRARPLLALVGSVAILGLLVGALAPVAGLASSHREAPLISGDPLVDTTDVWAFVSEDKPGTVTLLASWLPFEEPAGGPNFYKFEPGASYDINIDRNGDARADIIYRWVFQDHYRNRNTFLYNTGVVTSLKDPDLNFFQTYSLRRITPYSNRLLIDNAIVAPSNVGKTSMPAYADLFRAATYPLGEGATWAGQSDDAFFLDLRVFDLLYGAPTFSEAGDDTLAGFNVQTLGIQVPMRSLANDHNPSRFPIIGIWSTTSRRSTRVHTAAGGLNRSGPYVQVSRLGSPLVNEVVIPIRDKDRFNASKPRDDGQFLGYVTDPELAALLNAFYGVGAPEHNRADLVQVFLTGVPGLNQPNNVTPSEMLRLNMSIPPCKQGSCADYSRLGVIGGDLAGYPNGRRLADDVIDISLQVVAGELAGNSNDLSDAVNVNDVPFRSSFPYVALPHSGSDPDPH